jgi:O-methyltransferase
MNLDLPVVSACHREKLERLWVHVREAVDAIALGGLAEFGVWRGGTAWLMHEAAGRTRDLWLYDTFSGIPPSAVGAVDLHAAGDFGDNSLESVRSLFADRSNVHLVPGDFDRRRVPLEALVFVHIDADMFASYEAALPVFWDRLVLGGAMILDDYGVPSCEGATAATDRWRRDLSINRARLYFEPFAAPHFGALVKKLW